MRHDTALMRKYFGTDGIRGRVGQAPVTPEFMLRLGWAAGRVLAPAGGEILIGKDTRISGYMFESALEAGLSAAGVDIRLLGPMPTPAVACLTRTLRAAGGIVISASHNPYHDNGIKFFGRNGAKLPDDVELAIEAELDKPMQTVPSARLGKASRVVDAAGRYVEFCKNTIAPHYSLEGLRIVIDCANGAAYQVAPQVFRELGATVTAIGVEPDGLNINRDCGSTRPEALQQSVVEQGAELGVALDGDGDRLIMVDARGELLDGDELLFIIARHRYRAGRLGKGVVGTQMSNLGLEQAVQALGVDFHRARVGDRHVMEMLQARDCALGGESSGHIICLDKHSTGDGIIAALQVLAAVLDEGRPLHEIRREMNKCPQVMVNVELKHRFDPQASREVQQAIQAAERALAGQGRVLLRPSGTEPLVRVMVEGRDGALVQRLAEDLAATVRQAMMA